MQFYKTWKSLWPAASISEINFQNFSWRVLNLITRGVADQHPRGPQNATSDDIDKFSSIELNSNWQDKRMEMEI